ncbi:hypothetical protein BD410DRAFT_167148 [Rickenella mellea]|uniref:Uncharacterized protein n=1 Tax=Rickenella mellea TaxID=50990 RepID=A0A4Y7PHQ2_9AGAM|nr:hypothetical protein BD410DRAFT_167148 [Rickenella mellea]
MLRRVRLINHVHVRRVAGHHRILSLHHPISIPARPSLPAPSTTTTVMPTLKSNSNRPCTRHNRHSEPRIRVDSQLRRDEMSVIPVAMTRRGPAGIDRSADSTGLGDGSLGVIHESISSDAVDKLIVVATMVRRACSRISLLL